MAEPAARYVKLPGRAFGWAGPGRLWLAPDHVLQVTSTSISERYRRFYLRDIQAVLVLQTRARLIWNLIYGGLAAMSAASGGLVWWLATLIPLQNEQIAVYVFAGLFGALSVACLPFLLVNSVLGPTCAFYFRTQAGIDRLAAPGRVRAVRALLLRLEPLIISAQETRGEISSAVR